MHTFKRVDHRRRNNLSPPGHPNEVRYITAALDHKDYQDFYEIALHLGSSGAETVRHLLRREADRMAHDRGTKPGPETYTGPPHGWTCFHCGETFRTYEGAAEHFGTPDTPRPACVKETAP